jgi:hypothetical protein
VPAGAKLHNVFHVGLLKPFRGELPPTPGVLPPICHGQACIEPMAVEKSKITRGKLEVLVKWKGLAAAEASWMPLDEFCKLYPSFQLADELIVRRGGGRCHGGDNLQAVWEAECGGGCRTEHRNGRQQPTRRVKQSSAEQGKISLSIAIL